MATTKVNPLFQVALKAVREAVAVDEVKLAELVAKGQGIHMNTAHLPLKDGTWVKVQVKPIDGPPEVRPSK